MATRKLTERQSMYLQAMGVIVGRGATYDSLGKNAIALLEAAPDAIKHDGITEEKRGPGRPKGSTNKPVETANAKPAPTVKEDTTVNNATDVMALLASMQAKLDALTEENAALKANVKTSRPLVETEETDTHYIIHVPKLETPKASESGKSDMLATLHNAVSSIKYNGRRIKIMCKMYSPLAKSDSDSD